MISQNLLETLYQCGAEVVLVATDARQVAYSLKFDGQSEPLALTLPPGHYLFVKVADAPGAAAGLSGISKPEPMTRPVTPKPSAEPAPTV